MLLCIETYTTAYPHEIKTLSGKKENKSINYDIVEQRQCIDLEFDMCDKTFVRLKYAIVVGICIAVEFHVHCSVSLTMCIEFDSYCKTHRKRKWLS